MAMDYISKKMAQKFYDNILDHHKMNNSLFNKVPAIEDELEEMLALPELAGVNNESGGQKNWLKANRIKRVYGKIKSGVIPPDLVDGLLTIFPYRNKAKHEKKMSYACYLGIFDCMAQAISFFSNTPIPDEIQAICDGKKPEKNQKNYSVPAQVRIQNHIETNEIDFKRGKGSRTFNYVYILSYNGIDTSPYTLDEVKQKILNGEVSRDHTIIQLDTGTMKPHSSNCPYIDTIPELARCFDEYEEYWNEYWENERRQEQQRAVEVRQKVVKRENIRRITKKVLNKVFWMILSCIGICFVILSIVLANSLAGDIEALAGIFLALVFIAGTWHCIKKLFNLN
jgi:hypothetical protein